MSAIPRALERDCTTQVVQSILNHRAFLGLFAKRVPGRRMEDYGLSDRQSTDASDRAVDSRVVLVRTNDRLQHLWSRTC
jgi:hypothetical protein